MHLPELVPNLYNKATSMLGVGAEIKVERELNNIERDIHSDHAIDATTNGKKSAARCGSE